MKISKHIEYLKCKKSPLYFIENYCSVPVSGGYISIKESEQWDSSNKYKILINMIHQHDATIFMSSRQQGKTTTIALYVVWCLIFFPKMHISFLTIDKDRALDFISRCKEIMGSIPTWLQVDTKSNAERLTYYELNNGAKVTAKYVSGSVDPDSVGRGLSNPLVILDEVAFIPHAEIVWAAVQPSVSTAKIYARKNGYPHGVIFTTTPNGAGANFFYGMYKNSILFDDIYDYENKKLFDDYLDAFKDPEKNSFISIKLHWSETRTNEWYEEQKKELNFNQRKINQELDLVFLGSDNSIFSDEIISAFIPKKERTTMKLPFGHTFKIYSDIDPTRTYYLGVDTAMSAGQNSDFSALILTDAITGAQVAEWKGRFSVVKRYSALVKSCIKGLKELYGLNEDNLLIIIERNSIGTEVVEELVYNDPEVDDFDYVDYLYQEKMRNGEFVYGLFTSNSGKMGAGKRDQMFNYLMDVVNGNPEYLQGVGLIEEVRNLCQKTNGRIEASRGQHDDLVMAYVFTLYVRHHHIKDGILIVEGNSSFALNSDKLSAYLDVSFGGSSLGIYDEIDEELLYKQSKIKQSIENKELSIENYIVM